MTETARTVAFRMKATPEDFRVEEVADVEPADTGPYGLYRLTKRGWNTTDLVHRLARELGVPRSTIAYGGRKDLRAVTSQLVTIKDRRAFSVSTEAYALEWIGALDKPMAPNLLVGNRFEITLRSVAQPDVAVIERNASTLDRDGFLNYFDDQRFGSHDRDEGFAALYLLHGEWERALQLVLARDRREDPARERCRRAYFREHWWRWDECLAGSVTAAERNVFGFLATRGSDYPAAVNRLPHDLLSMVFAAYQSFLWNETARALVSSAARRVSSLPGVAGPYVFPMETTTAGAARLRALVLPTADARTVPADPEAASVYRRLLEREQLTTRSFRLREVQRAFFRSSPRHLVVTPAGLEVAAMGADELDPGRHRLTLRFTLPPGSYATMMLKRLSLLPA